VGQDCLKFGQCEGGAVAGDGFQLVQSAAGVAEGAAADHGDGEAAGSGDGSDQEAGLVSHAAGGVLVDGGLAEARGDRTFRRSRAWRG
jgi:hypothetical protein